MPTDRAAIRRRAVHIARTDGRSRGFASRDGVTALVSTAGAARTLTDTAALPPTGAAATTAKNEWLFLPSVAAAADRKRLIASYSGALQTITHNGPDYAAATITELGTGSEPYLVLKDDPDVWDQAINEAMRTLVSKVNYSTITLVDDKPRYVLSAAPFTLTGIERISQVVEIERADSGDTAGEETWTPWGDGYGSWRAYPSDDDIILDFGPRAPTTADKLRVKWTSQASIFVDETTDQDVNEYFAALATLVVMVDWLADPNNGEDDWNVIGRRIRTQYAAQRRLALGGDAWRQVTRGSQQTGIVGIGGRMGRS